MTQTHLTQRHGYSISFRRNDADRRPSRVVRQPNDGPDPDRWVRAAALRAVIESQRPFHPSTTERREAVLRELLKGSITTRDLAAALGFSPSNTSDITSSLAKEGLVLKARPKHGEQAVMSLTDAGRALVTEQLAA